MKLEQLEENVREWSKARGILDQSTYTHQIIKYGEELDEMRDAIGDMVVCQINAGLLAETEGQVQSTKLVILAIQGIAISARVDFEECLEMAWNAIKNRVGVMIDGKFVKWENLNREFRIEVARTGQLEREGVNLEHLKAQCTDDEWAVIHEARNA